MLSIPGSMYSGGYDSIEEYDMKGCVIRGCVMRGSTFRKGVCVPTRRTPWRLSVVRHETSSVRQVGWKRIVFATKSHHGGPL